MICAAFVIKIYTLSLYLSVPVSCFSCIVKTADNFASFSALDNVTNVAGISSPATYKVVDCLEHAILAVNPKKRYYAGWDSALFYSWFALLPAEVTDPVLRLIEKLLIKPLLPKAVKDKKY